MTRPWRLGGSWSAKDPTRSPLVTLVEFDPTEEPDEQGRRPSDVLVGVATREDASMILRLIDEARDPDEARSWAKANFLVEIEDVGYRVVGGLEAQS